MRQGRTALVTRPVRVLRDADRPQVEDALAADPVSAVFVAGRVAAYGISRWRLGAQLWGYAPHGTVEGLCFSGANLIPLSVDPEAVSAFGSMAREQGRVCSSIVGPAAAVLPLWADLAPMWGRPREMRTCQPLLATAAVPRVPADPAVRRATLADFDALLPACVAMYTEEVGVSPLDWDGGSGYRARVTGLIRAGRCFVRTEGGEVVFKAELGAVSRRAAQVQGVWVRPDRRGEGIATRAMAAVVAAALESTAPIVSLYVNDYNAPARAVYERCGFTRVGTFATVLF
ncbi:MAG TPA: GNAT family N-acetyltransferase [Cryptosporangiaceae bacterium]|nr:GNAT family N-acetyltransferase [Cryptosporangiaceae bacterium]